MVDDSYNSVSTHFGVDPFYPLASDVSFQVATR